MRIEKHLQRGVVIGALGVLSVLAQTPSSIDGPHLGDPVSNAMSQLSAQQIAANSLQTAQKNLEMNAEIQRILAEANGNIGTMNTNIAQANLQKQQCETDYSEAVAQADSQAAQQKTQALTNMLGQSMNPLLQGFQNATNKEGEMEQENINGNVDFYNKKVEGLANMYPKVFTGGVTDPAIETLKRPVGDISPSRKLDIDPALLKCQQLGSPAVVGQTVSQSGFASQSSEQTQCMQAVYSIAAANNDLNNEVRRFRTDQAAKSGILGSIAQAAIPMGMGLVGYSMTNKSAQETAEGQKRTAKLARDQCIAEKELEIKDMKRQLAALELNKKQSIEAALAGSKLALQALTAEQQARALAELAQSALDPTVPQLNVDPNTLEGANLALGPIVGDPNAPMAAANAAAQPGAGNTNPAAPTGSGGGGAAPGGGGGGGTNWTFGSAYPSFSGGGGLPQQPQKGTWSGGGGGAGGGGGGAGGVAADAMYAFQGDNDEIMQRAAASRGDGGMLSLMQRARLRLSAHAPELLTSNHMDILSRKTEVPKAPQIERATASRI